MNWLLKNIIGAFADLVTGFLDFVGTVVIDIFDNIATINISNTQVVNASRFTTMFGLALLTLMAIKHYLTVYMLETDGDPDADPINILVRLSQAVALICCNTYIFDQMMLFSRAFADDLSSSPGTPDFTVTASSYIQAAMTGYSSSIVGSVILLLVVVIGVIIFCVIAGIRGAELSLMKIAFPIFAVDLLTTNRERWNAFLTTYVITFITYAVQIFCFRMFCSSFSKIIVEQFNENMLIMLGWFILMLRTPKWLERFCYSSGIGRAAGGGMRMAQFMLFKGK